MKRLLILFIVLWAGSAYAEIYLIDDIRAKNDAFTVMCRMGFVGDAATDSCIDMDADGVIDPRRLLNSRYSGMDGWVVHYAWTGDSLYLKEVTGGGGSIKWRDSSYLYLDTLAILKASDSIGAHIRDSLQANYTSIGWGLALFETGDSVNVDSTDLDDVFPRLPTTQDIAHDTLWANTPGYLTANQNITLSGDATGSGTTAITVALSAAVVDSVEVVNQSIKRCHIDSTLNQITVSGISKGLQAVAESAFVTIETIEDSLKLVGRVAGQAWTGAHDFGGATSTEIANDAAPTVDAEGEVAWETDDDHLHIYDGVADVVLSAKTKSRSFVLLSPADYTLGPVAIWQTPQDITITAVSAVLTFASTDTVLCLLGEVGTSGSGTFHGIDGGYWYVGYAAEFTDASFTSPNISAGYWLAIDLGGTTGEPYAMSLTFEYYIR